MSELDRWTQPRTRRDILVAGGKLSLVLAGGSLLAACQTSPAPSTSKTAKNTLVVAEPYVPQNLDREFGAGDPINQELNMQMVEPLMEWKRKLRPDGAYDFDFSGYDPVLAQSWQVSADGRTCTFTLRQGVKSPKGNELTAEVLKWNYDRYFGLKGTGLFFMQVLNIASPDDVKIIDKYTISLTSSKPSSLWLSVQPQHFLGPFDAVEYKSQATSSDPWALEFGKQNIVGFGPYQIQSRIVGQQTVLIPNPNYWGKKPQFDQVIFKEVPQDAIRYSLLLSGDVDMARNLSFAQLAQLKGQSGVKVYDFLSSDLTEFPIQTEHQYLSDKRVRQAMAWALPYDQIIQNIYKGLATQPFGPLPQMFPGFDKTLWPYHQDLNKAKSLLSDAGLANGFSTTITYATGIPEDEPLVLLMQSAFKQVGINAELNKVTPSALSQNEFMGQFDIGLKHGGSNDPDQYYSYFLEYDKDSVINYPRWKNDQVTSLIRQGLVSQDTQQRLRAGKQIQQTIIDEVPYLELGEAGIHWPVRSNVSGIFQRINREIVYADIVKT